MIRYVGREWLCPLFQLLRTSLSRARGQVTGDATIEMDSDTDDVQQCSLHRCGRQPRLDVDICRAMAAAILGSADKVQYRPLTAPERFTALRSGEIDLLSRNTTRGTSKLHDLQRLLLKQTLSICDAAMTAIRIHS